MSNNFSPVYIYLFFSVFLSCFSDLDDQIIPASNVEVNDFIYRSMQKFYLYKESVPSLAEDRFDSSSSYTDYLNSKEPKDFFESIKSTNPKDAFSWIVADYVALEKAFAGISRTNGMQYAIFKSDKSESRVCGVVEYVLPNTDAESQNIKRGMLFNKVDGVVLDQSNYQSLLASSTYALGIAKYVQGIIVDTDQIINLTKTEYTRNPIFINKTLDVNGTPVGYLLYNSFVGNFDSQLNTVFGKFKAEGVKDLILDLRYNGGGSVDSAIDLASMITGQFAGEVFTREEWNKDLQQQFGSVNRFDNQIRTGETIQSLGLSRLYVITTTSSASASELIINGLDPYIQVIQLGETTRGKFQASITLYDSPSFGRINRSLAHTYAIQPLVLKSLNAVGFTDYFDGFQPEIPIQEDYSNMGVLGDPEEPLLRAAIQSISGKKFSQKKSKNKTIKIGESDMFCIDYQQMYHESF